MQLNKVKTLGFVTELLYPKRCPGCDKILNKKDYNKGFCFKCSQNIKLAKKCVCLKCGTSIKDDTTEYCQNCKDNKHFFTQGKGIFRYSGPMKKAMYRYKYGNRRCYSRIFAYWARKTQGRWIDEKEIEVVIPVPMFEGKKKKRGYNQAEAFGKAISNEFGFEYNGEIIRRVRDTVALKQLNSRERRENLQNAFKIDEDVVKFKKVLVVDDIYTTGSTMDEISKVLKQHGVEQIYCLCVCVGESV